MPVVQLTDGTRLHQPTLRDLAEHVGLQTRPRQDDYDTLIIGGGPAGLALRCTVPARACAPWSSSVRRRAGRRHLFAHRELPGFPNGVSGDELASRALQQARRLGAEILVTRGVESMDPATRGVLLDGGERVRARSVILATGVSWRRLVIEGFDRLIGKGIYYGAARSEASSTHGQDVFLIGAGNSAARRRCTSPTTRAR